MFLNIFASIDLVFYFIFGIAVLFGFLRGFKKSIYTFIVMAIFYIAFFLTLNAAVEMLWSMELGFLGSVLSNIDPSLSNFTSFENDYQLIVQALFNNSFDFSQPDMDALAIGLIQFVVKIVWAIAYFTIVLIIYKIITGIIRILFIRNKKNKHRLFGAIVGGMNGAMAVFVTLIVLGGSISFIESLSLIIPEETAEQTETLSFEPRNTFLDLNHSLIPQEEVNQLNAEESDPLIPAETRQMMTDLVENYNNNIIVITANVIQVPSTFNEDVKVPLHINLFDQVLSFEYKDENIALRHEISMFSKAFNVIQNSDYGQTDKITDISGEDIRKAFEYLEESVLLPTALPILIKYYSDENEIVLSISDEELYDYDYAEELGRLSNIIAGMFDILNERAVSVDELGNEVPVDEDLVNDIFSDISESRIVLLATEAFLVPMITDEESDLSKLIDIPANFSWEDEYVALGNIIASLIDNNISIKAIESADLTTLLSSLSNVEPTVLLGSEILTSALINILSGEAETEGVEFLTVPMNIQWRSSETETGELEYLLTAIQKLMIDVVDFNFESLDMDVFTELSDSTITSLLDSYIMRATITTQIESLDFGDVLLVIPNDALDSQDYYTKLALSNLIISIKVIYDQLETFDLDTLYTMTTSELNTLFTSKIIRASITAQIVDLDLGTFALLIPDNVFEATDYMFASELVSIVTAIQVISDDLDGFTISSLYQLTSGELDALLSSSIIQATISDIILENAVLTPSTSQLSLVVPQFFRETIVVNALNTEQIKLVELKAIVNALNALGIMNYDGGLSPNLLTTSLDYQLILDSGSMHVSIDNIIDSNPNLDVPALAVTSLYGFNNITIDTEIIALIVAANTISSTSSVADVSFTFDDIVELSSTEQSLILDSMIVRNMITKDLIDEGASFPNSDYENDDPSTFLKKASIIDLL